MRFPSITSLLAGAVLACTSLVSAADKSANGAIQIQDVQLSLMSADGSSQHGEKLEYPTPSLTNWALEPDSILRLTFGIIDSSNGKGFAPQHAHVRFTDAETAATTLLPVQIKGKGKARFDLKSSTLPASIRASSGTHTLTLLLGHPSSIAPLSYTFGTVSLPAPRLLPVPKHRHDLSSKKDGEPAFVVQPEIEWTFNTGEKVVGKGVSAVGTGIVVGLPVAVWFMTGARVLPNLKTQSATPTTLLFLLSLIGLEALILKYWINWRLYQFLPPFLGLGVISAYIGKVALGQVQKRRIAAQVLSTGSVVVDVTANGKGGKVGVVKTK
ncbi:hypothetical protein QFC21_007018 [Naganishia friedmannii]|uniref:Uncharacterized protein n=1 Tax=Naganishia friedmannii TaxID=89922 RepID=A0ACC2UYX4_9TREE|nr:hypothetical protein QFC21_007018 [Naganishia friedmannii]